jgi:hypothetical protein
MGIYGGVHVHTYMKRVFPSLVRWDPQTGTRDFCPVLAALVSLVQNIFSSLHIIPSTIKLGIQSCRVTHLICVTSCALANLVQYKNLKIFFSFSGFRAFGVERSDRPRERAGESEQKERLAQAADRKTNQISSRYGEKFILLLLVSELVLSSNLCRKESNKLCMLVVNLCSLVMLPFFLFSFLQVQRCSSTLNVYS